MRSRSIQVRTWDMSGSFDRCCRRRPLQDRADDPDEGRPVDAAFRESGVTGSGGPVVLAGGPSVGRDQSGTHPSFALEAGEGGVDGAFEDVGQSDLVQALHDLVSVGLTL